MTIYSNPPQKMGNFSVNSMHSTRLSWSSYSAACWGTWRRPCWAGAAPVRAGAFPRDLRQLLFLGWKNQLNISDLVVLRSIFFESVFCKDVLLENHRRGMMMDGDPQWLSQIFEGVETNSQLGVIWRICGFWSWFWGCPTLQEYAKHMHEQAKHEWVQVLRYIHIAHLPSFDGGCSEHLILQVWTRWKPVGTGYGRMGLLIPKHSYSYEVYISLYNII